MFDGTAAIVDTSPPHSGTASLHKLVEADGVLTDGRLKECGGSRVETEGKAGGGPAGAWEGPG